MKDTCTKYESLFIFGNEQDLQAHIQLCPDCREEHEKMQKVASIVKEVKPLYRKNPLNNKIKLKIAACFIIMACSFWAYDNYTNKTIAQLNYESELLIKSGHSLIEDQGLPTDEYGLLTTE